MKKKPRRSLFVTLLGAISAVVVVAFAVNVALAIFTARGPLERLADENLQYVAQTRLAAVDHHLDACAQDIAAWSGLNTMDDVILQDRHLRITNLLLGLQRNQPDTYLELAVVAPDGMIIASSDAVRVGRMIAASEADLREIGRSGYRAGEFPVQRSSAFWLLGHTIKSRLTTEPVGLLLAHVNWKTVSDLVTADVVDGEPQSVDRFLLLFGDSGDVLAGNPAVLTDLPGATDAALRIGGGAATASLGDGGPYVVAHEVLQRGTSFFDRELSVVAFWKRSEAYAGFDAVARAILSAAALGIGLAVAAALVIASRIGGRVRTLVEATSRLAAGDLTHRVEDKKNDELGSLARSFNHMGVGLDQAKQKLQATVARWKSLVEHVPDFVLTIDRQGLVQFANHAVSDSEMQRLVGSSVYSLFHDKYRQELSERVEEVFATGSPRSLELEATGDAPALYHTRIGPVLRDDQVEAAILISTEITERRALERKSLEVAESERQRIGQDIHDGLGQLLTGTALISRRLQTQLEAQGLRDADEAAKIGVLIRKALEQSRALAKGLFPIALERQGLQGALEELVETVETVIGVSCRIEGRTALDLEDRETATHLFRIAQEAVNNSLRHGQASKIVIRVGSEDGRNYLIVSDDGVGLENNDTSSNGMGLRLMRYRAAMIGAAIEIESESNEGTTVTCSF